MSSSCKGDTDSGSETISEESCNLEVEQFSQNEKDQKLRADLRIRFIQGLNKVIGRDCEITTCENTKVQGSFQGLDSDLSTICMENLVTPMGTIPTAFLRSTDIVCISFPLHKDDFIVK